MNIYWISYTASTALGLEGTQTGPLERSQKDNMYFLITYMCDPILSFWFFGFFFFELDWTSGDIISLLGFVSLFVSTDELLVREQDASVLPQITQMRSWNFSIRVKLPPRPSSVDWEVQLCKTSKHSGTQQEGEGRSVIQKARSMRTSPSGGPEGPEMSAKHTAHEYQSQIRTSADSTVTRSSWRAPQHPSPPGQPHPGAVLWRQQGSATARE